MPDQLDFNKIWVTNQVSCAELLKHRIIHISDDLFIECIPGKNAQDDILIKFHIRYNGHMVCWCPKMKELWYWIRLKGKIEENNYPIDKKFAGMHFLHMFLSSSLDHRLTWDDAKKIYKIPE